MVLWQVCGWAQSRWASRRQSCSRAMSGLIVGLRGWDPAVFASVAGALAAVAMLASYLPSLRATRVAPVDVLRGG